MNIPLKISAAISTLLVFLGIGTISYLFLEGWSYAQSFYFSVVTLSTVGYGNIHPTTPASQMFTAFYILIGVAAVITSLSVIGSAILDKREKQLIKKIERKKEKENRH